MVSPSQHSEPLELRDLTPYDDYGDSATSAVPMRSQEDILEDTSFDKSGGRNKLLKLGVSFFLFGLFNEVLYIIILSAALDLVPPSTPKGIIAFCNIFPALVAKLGWSYILKGKIRYTRRVVGCTLLTFIGTLVVALNESLYARLLGICFASFSSGLGELTYLQLSTTYSHSVGGHTVGYFAAGTGASGLFGAFLWWNVRGLGVRLGVGLCAILPFVLPLTYFLLLPCQAEFMDSPSPASYAPLPEDDPDTALTEVIEEDIPSPKVPVFLTARDKWHLVRPTLLKYMLPLFLVYIFEYTINQGVAPTLLYPVPSPDHDPLLSKIIHSIRDYYPLWQLVYQSTVFLSRSSISIGLPPLPERLLPLPAIAQFLILATLAYEAAVGVFSDDHPATSIVFVFLLISIEGTCGGLAYVNAFYRINQQRPDPSTVIDPERARQELEFKIGSLSFSNVSGVLIASLLAIPTEVVLCRAQVARGKMFCEGL